MKPDAYKQKASKVWKKKHGILVTSKKGSSKEDRDGKSDDVGLNIRRQNSPRMKDALKTKDRNETPPAQDDHDIAVGIEDEEVEELLDLIRGASSSEVFEYILLWKIVEITCCTD